jgi:hypothetical protein
LLTNINKQLQQQERKEKKKTKIINITRAKKQNEENYWCVCVFSWGNFAAAAAIIILIDLIICVYLITKWVK